jgi:hypothetical protein
MVKGLTLILVSVVQGKENSVEVFNGDMQKMK